MRKAICVLMVLFLLCSVSMAFAWGENNASLYEKAVSLLRESKYAEAAQSFADLGGYSDAPRYTMYCNAIVAGENGQYDMAVTNLSSLNGFLDSQLLAVYYTGLSYEAVEDYEHAAEVLSVISLYRDVTQRLVEYPERIHARDYLKADQSEKAGAYESALSGFEALGSYKDSRERVTVVQEKINDRDYNLADQMAQQDRLEDALKAFKALGDYRDSAERVNALQAKMDERDAAAAEKAKADAYAAAEKAEQAEDYAAAFAGFSALGEYKDSAERAATVRNKGTYAQAMQYAMSGRFGEAYDLFKQLGDYEDSAEKAYVLGITAFAEVSDRGDGVAAYRFHGLWGLLNVSTGANESPSWDEIGQFNKWGLAPVVRNGLTGCINTNGEVVIPCQWASISEFNTDGLCTVVKKTTSSSGWSSRDTFLFGLYDAKGQEITPAKWRQLGKSRNSDWDSNWNACNLFAPSFPGGKAMVQARDGLFGFIDDKGNLLGEVRWNSIRDFSEDVAVVEAKGKYGYIDANGQTVIEPQYEDALPFSETLAGVKTGGLWQYIDHKNQVVISPKYSEARPFSGGTADVLLARVGWQVIDKSGKLVYFVSQKTEDAYLTANALLNLGKYDDAYTAYSDLAGYKDADDLKVQTKYRKAVSFRENGEFDAARKIFGELGDYSDAAEQIQATYYAEGEAKRAAEEWDEAVSAFEKAGDYADAAEKIQETYYAYAQSQAWLVPYRNVGGYVTFGSYPQTASGTDSTPIEWLVLDYDADNNCSLLISRYGLDIQPYNKTYTNTSWEKCTLRTWLNDTFLNKAFTMEEQLGIQLTNVDNSISQGYRKWNIKEGNNTQDMIFLLSYAEANKYFGVAYGDGKKVDATARIAATAYAEKQGAYTNNNHKTEDGAATTWWWLRSPGNSRRNAAHVDYDGSLTPRSVSVDRGCVRPAMWIDLNADIFGLPSNDVQYEDTSKNTIDLQKESDYQAAEALYLSQDYEGALSIYKRIQGYKDADSKIAECDSALTAMAQEATVEPYK